MAYKDIKNFSKNPKVKDLKAKIKSMLKRGFDKEHIKLFKQGAIGGAGGAIGGAVATSSYKRGKAAISGKYHFRKHGEYYHIYNPSGEKLSERYRSIDKAKSRALELERGK